jgi:hypothetical protein
MCKWPAVSSLLLLGAGLLTAAARAQPEPLSAEQLAAVERAQQVLVAKLDAKQAAHYPLLAIEAKEWPDSSLGCRTPGATYLQVITHGYVVLLGEGGHTHEVHVAGEHAVVCPRTASGFREPQPRVRATQLPQLEKLARADLATQLGVSVESIRIVQRVPKRWTQTSLECRNSEQTDSAAIPGFKLYLRHEARVYTYHTDEARVFACPVIGVK